MPKKSKTLCVDDLRHAEYYGMQEIFDELYQKSQNGEVFNNLLDLILSKDNILLAYRNIKANKGSYTAGTDNKNITDIGGRTPDEVIQKVRFIVTGSEHGYRPKPVRRKDIPKPNGKTRPLGIPCIWDRLIQQCIKQILEPICEAKFSNNSYGFRPNRSVEHAMNRTYTMLQMMNLHYVIEFDIKGFFDNVNHSKLIRQIWALGIHDKSLIYIIKRILTAPIRMPDNSTVIPDKGTPQGGIISPLLANIVLNELDWWVSSQWEENPIAVSRGRERIIGKTKVFDKSHGYRLMKNTDMKEMHIIRYADDFRIFCRTKEDAVRTKEAVAKWIEDRLRLEVSPEKTRIVNTRKRWSEFLGFKIRVRLKHHKYVVQSAICDKKVEIEREKLVEQAKNIAKPREKRSCLAEIQLFNSMVLGIQNYYQLATCISLDCRDFHRRIMTVLTNRLNTEGYEVLSVREVTGLFTELRQTAGWFTGIYLAVFLIAGLFIYMMMKRTVERMEKLQEVAEKQELLMGALSHEMRTPLTSIIGYSDTLRHVKLKDEQKDRALEHINREGKRLEALSGKMLQLLGLYQNHAIQMEMTPAGELLKNVIDMEREPAEKKNVQLKTEYEAFSMKMDAALMESLLVNLIDNALKATVAGGSIWVKAYEKAGKKIFEVSDTGIGIPEEELGKITDAFYMVDKSRSRKEGGSGLGLALCVKVAELHGGFLQIESQPGEGTTVRAVF